jgi:hypothetical protein
MKNEEERDRDRDVLERESIFFKVRNGNYLRRKSNDRTLLVKSENEGSN